MLNKLILLLKCSLGGTVLLIAGLIFIGRRGYKLQQWKEDDCK